MSMERWGGREGGGGRVCNFPFWYFAVKRGCGYISTLRLKKNSLIFRQFCVFRTQIRALLAEAYTGAKATYCRAPYY